MVTLSLCNKPNPWYRGRVPRPSPSVVLLCLMINSWGVALVSAAAPLCGGGGWGTLPPGGGGPGGPPPPPHPPGSGGGGFPPGPGQG